MVNYEKQPFKEVDVKNPSLYVLFAAIIQITQLLVWIGHINQNLPYLEQNFASTAIKQLTTAHKYSRRLRTRQIENWKAD